MNRAAALEVPRTSRRILERSGRVPRARFGGADLSRADAPGDARRAAVSSAVPVRPRGGRREVEGPRSRWLPNRPRRGPTRRCAQAIGDPLEQELRAAVVVVGVEDADAHEDAGAVVREALDADLPAVGGEGALGDAAVHVEGGAEALVLELGDRRLPGGVERGRELARDLVLGVLPVGDAARADGGDGGQAAREAQGETDGQGQDVDVLHADPLVRARWLSLPRVDRGGFRRSRPTPSMSRPRAIGLGGGEGGIQLGNRWGRVLGACEG